MPKSIVVDPRETRKQGKLSLCDIPLNLYVQDLKKEAENRGKETLLRVYRDMVVIREFETMLNSIKTKGAYQGISYDHAGPAHLSIGQESAVVGQCLTLGVEDFIFGSHRSHGEIIAKCLSATAKLPEKKLTEIMETYMGGAPLRVVQKGHSGSLRDLAIDYSLYGTLAEIFGRENGFNKGMGGSMHAFFAPFGSMPNNAIVGGSADISVGAALFKRINRKPGIVIANIGDGSSACGPVWEAMMVAAMDQYRTLWPKEIGGAPPILFNFFNNFYGMGGQTMGETMGFKVLARIGAGVNPEQMHAERVDGYNPLAVADAIERKRKILQEGKGPVLLDVVTYRYSGHSPSDASSYRTKEEVALWQEVDCIRSYGDSLVAGKIAKAADLEAIQKETTERLRRITEMAVSLETSPRIATEPDAIGDMMFSNGNEEKTQEGEPEMLLPVEKNPRVIANGKKSRSGIGPDGKPLPKPQVIALKDAIFEAVLHRFSRDPSMVAFGEENRDWGGAFAVYRGLTEALPYQRLFNTPISEGAIVGAAVGYAMCGGQGCPRADVLRLPWQVGRRSVQPAVQVAGDVRGRSQDARGASRVRRQQVRGAAFAGLELTGVPYPGAQGHVPCHSLRCQGHDEPCPAGNRSGGFFREPAHLRHRRAFCSRRSPHGLLRGAGGRAGAQAPGLGRYDRHDRSNPVPGH